MKANHNGLQRYLKGLDQFAINCADKGYIVNNTSLDNGCMIQVRIDEVQEFIVKSTFSNPKIVEIIHHDKEPRTEATVECELSFEVNAESLTDHNVKYHLVKDLASLTGAPIYCDPPVLH